MSKDCFNHRVRETNIVESRDKTSAPGYQCSESSPSQRPHQTTSSVDRETPSGYPSMNSLVVPPHSTRRLLQCRTNMRQVFCSALLDPFDGHRIENQRKFKRLADCFYLFLSTGINPKQSIQIHQSVVTSGSFIYTS